MSKLVLKLKEDGTLLETLAEEHYAFKTVVQKEEEEVNEEGQKVLVTYLIHTFFTGPTRDYPTFVFKEETGSTVLQDEVDPVVALVSQSRTVVDLVNILRAKAVELIKDLPLKNATQREYALTVALTDEGFAKDFLLLPEKFRDTVIQ